MGLERCRKWKGSGCRGVSDSGAAPGDGYGDVVGGGSRGGSACARDGRVV